MRGRKNILNLCAAAGLVLSSIFLVLSIGNPRLPGDTDSAAKKVERILERRMILLDELATHKKTGLIPPDMVIYRYENDSLKSWNGQFSVQSDDIDAKVVIQRLVNPRMAASSPLSEIGDSIGFFNFGPKWYLAKRVVDGNTTIIEGLTVVNSFDTRSFNGNNSRLRLSDQYSIKPLSTTGGSEVRVGGKPQFKIIYDSLEGSATADAMLVWISLAFLILAAICFLIASPKLKRFIISSSALIAAFSAIFLWGLAARGDSKIFSPVLYADGTFFYSLGAVIIINAAIAVLCFCIHIVRNEIPENLKKPLGIILSAAILTYTYFSVSSIILNSDICLELYKIEELSVYSVLVLISFFTMLTGIPLLLGLFWKKIFSNPGRFAYSTIVAGFFIAVPALLGLQKEGAKLEVWANRLAIDRDIALELQLRGMENQIAEDVILASLSLMENNAVSIENRLKETYFIRQIQDYDVKVIESTDELPAFKRGEPIAENSRFIYVNDGSARPIYFGIFFYNIPGYPLSQVTIKIEQTLGTGLKGYSKLLSYVPPGKIEIPSFYSYARYLNHKLLAFQGDFAYPITLNEKVTSEKGNENFNHYYTEGYIHFSYRISDEEKIIISRPNVTKTGGLVALIILWLALYLLVSVFKPSREVIFEQSYYRKRISWIMMSALFLTLVTLTTVSVIFVYQRSDSNRRSLLSGKINAVQSMIGVRIRGDLRTEDLRNPEFLELMEHVGNVTGTDITLYAPDGKVFLSTNPSIFESRRLGSRINYSAFKSITTEGQRYHIELERLGRRIYYSMYAPLMSATGNLIAIICVPYTDDNTSLEKDAAAHLLTIIAVFFVLLLISRFFSLAIVDRMFKPLSEMGRKMSAAGDGKLEMIEYERDDEIASLVKAYNSMVVRLTESSLQLAQAERDKAWSGMARQVAHEIKNPLTPMKLQLQRIIRMKERGGEGWEEKFDEVSKVILDHIDILTETANEFSTFAKLYTEEPTTIELDKLLQDEIAMYDSKGDIEFEYFGLSGAKIIGPKPQLTRVFVNLINNAVQALDDSQTKKVCISLRNSGDRGYYDIVFEDSGPGVSDENRAKLFTPNFTTKSGGSGLGLAISHSILEKCEATISYSKSFRLEGACFTIKYPKLDEILS